MRLRGSHLLVERELKQVELVEQELPVKKVQVELVPMRK